MSIREFINNRQELINNGTKLHKIWKGRAPSPGNKLEINKKERGRLATIISNGKKWNSRAVANKLNSQEFKKVQNAMNKLSTHNQNENNKARPSMCTGLLCQAKKMLGISGGNYTHKRKQKRNRTKRTKRNRN